MVPLVAGGGGGARAGARERGEGSHRTARGYPGISTGQRGGELHGLTPSRHPGQLLRAGTGADGPGHS